MERKSRNGGRAKSIPAGLALGCVLSVGITVIFAGIVAKLIDLEKMKETAIGYSALGILLAASYLGCVTAGEAIKHRKAMVCGLGALIYYLILVSATALFFGGEYRGMGVTALVVLCGGVLAFMTTARKGREGSGKRKRKYAYR